MPGRSGPATGRGIQPAADPAAAAEVDPEELIANAEAAANFLKALGHEGRLMILCHLISGPKSVTELETLLSSRQAAVSQQLARLRLEGLVSARREGQTIFYSILDPKVQAVVSVLDGLFCNPAKDRNEG